MVVCLDLLQDLAFMKCFLSADLRASQIGLLELLTGGFPLGAGSAALAHSIFVFPHPHCHRLRLHYPPCLLRATQQDGYSQGTRL